MHEPETEAPSAEPREAPAPAPELGALASEMTRLRESMARLAARTESDAALMQRKDEIIADISRELQNARGGFVGAILRPIFEENTRIVMDIELQLARAARGDPVDTTALLDLYRQRLLLGMEGSGLFAQPPSELDAPLRFDPRRQVIERAVGVDDPELHQCIARVVMPAFHLEGKPLLLERVDVYRYRKPEPPTSGESAS
ncbi:hypothetical protein SAMN05216567_11421 [Variovorax sp. OK605]|jgi:hypothetical protein|nr:hypothetical protein SAMN05216567_11421 [Variovorax sp. OK605]